MTLVYLTLAWLAGAQTSSAVALLAVAGLSALCSTLSTLYATPLASYLGGPPLGLTCDGKPAGGSCPKVAGD